jgi:hypothetical protein
MGNRQLDISAVNTRLFEAMESDFQRLCMKWTAQVADGPESEIELLIAACINTVSHLSRLRVCFGEVPAGIDAHMLVIPQYKWEGYRIDFCIEVPGKRIFVECDGHDFHERTKEQAERDRSKDRAIQAAGIPILRFTGREIWRDPLGVLMEIFRFAGVVENNG